MEETKNMMCKILGLLLSFLPYTVYGMEKSNFYINENLILNNNNKNIIIDISGLKQNNIEENLEKQEIVEIKPKNLSQQFLDSLNHIDNLSSQEGRKLFSSINKLLETNEHLILLMSEKYKGNDILDEKNLETIKKYSDVWANNSLKVKLSDSPSFQEAKMSNKEEYNPEHILNLSNTEFAWSENIWESEIIDLSSCVETTFFEQKTEKLELGFRCGSGQVPRFLVIAHELLHYLHFLENPIQYKLDRTNTDKSYHPSIKNLNRDVRWRISEEERTLIGRFDFPDDISEFSLRFKEELPIRYAYQGKDQHFYEKCDDLKDILPAKYTPKYKDSFLFDEEKAENIFLSPEAKTKLFKKEEEVLLQNSGGGFKLPAHLSKKLKK